MNISDFNRNDTYIIDGSNYNSDLPEFYYNLAKGHYFKAIIFDYANKYIVFERIDKFGNMLLFERELNIVKKAMIGIKNVLWERR